MASLLLRKAVEQIRSLWKTNVVRSYLTAIFGALVIGAILLGFAGVNPVTAYPMIWTGAFGSVRAVTETLVKTIPLLIISSGLTIAFKCNLWNIGAEGQLYLGAIFATWIGISVFTGGLLYVPIMIIAGFLAGGLWAAVSGILKAKLKANEVLVTMMLNSVAFLLMDYVLLGPLQDPEAQGFPISPFIVNSAYLPKLWSTTRLHAGIILAISAPILMYLVLLRTNIGYKIRAVGVNPKAARYGGIDVAKSMMIAMFLSGGFAGVAGAIEICGVHHRLLKGISPGYGYTGIIVALLGKMHPIGIALASFLFAALEIGTDAMARSLNLPINKREVERWF